MGLSTFKNLRPKHILSSQTIPMNMFLCKNHENIRLLLHRLNRITSVIPVLSSKVVKKWICKSATIACWMGTCRNCQDAKLFLEAYPLERVEPENSDPDTSDSDTNDANDAEDDDQTQSICEPGQYRWLQWISVVNPLSKSGNQRLTKTSVHGNPSSFARSSSGASSTIRVKSQKRKNSNTFLAIDNF